MVAWATDIAPALAFAGLLWLGGAGIARLAGARSASTVVYSALPIAVVVVGLVGVTQMWFQFAFGWVAVAVAFALAGVAALVAGLGWRRLPSRWIATGPAPERRAGWWLSLALLLGSLLLGLTVVWLASAGTFEVVSQTWDAMFDANAVRYGFETSNLSPTHLAVFPLPQPAVASYYPSTFHAVCVLFMQLAGTDAVVPTNVVAGLIAGGLWPSAAVLGASFTAGRSRWVTLSAAVLSWGFYAAPWSPLGWGVLWATSMAAALAPVALAGLIQTFGFGLVRRPLPLSAAVAVGGIALVGLMHPRTVVIILVLAVGLWAWSFGARSLRARAVGEPWTRWAVLTFLPAPLLLFAVFFVDRGMEARLWPVERPLWAELGSHLVNGVVGSWPQPITAALVLAGAWWAIRHGRAGAAVLWGGAVILDVTTAAIQGNYAVNGLARFWYNDRHRVLPLTAWLALLLALYAVAALHDRWRHGGLRMVGLGQTSSGALVVGLAALVVLNGSLAAGRALWGSLAGAANNPVTSLVSPDEIRFYREVAQVVPPQERIMNNANDGSALLYAYQNRRPIFLIGGVRGSTHNAASAFDRFITLNKHDLCTFVAEDHVYWLLDGGRAFSGTVIKEQQAPGLRVPPGGHWALTPVLSSSAGTLYEITGCPHP